MVDTAVSNQVVVNVYDHGEPIQFECITEAIRSVMENGTGYRFTFWTDNVSGSSAAILDLSPDAEELALVEAEDREIAEADERHHRWLAAGVS